jgi:hypothetical protein
VSVLTPEAAATSVPVREEIRVRRRYVAIGGLVAGATFLWLVPPFVACTAGTPAVSCALLVVLGIATVAAFALASWALLTLAAWWPKVAVLAGALGLLTTAGYTLIAVPAPPLVEALQLLLHVVIAAAALAVAGVPRLRRLVEGPDRGGAVG